MKFETDGENDTVKYAMYKDSDMTSSGTMDSDKNIVCRITDPAKQTLVLTATSSDDNRKESKTTIDFKNLNLEPDTGVG